MWFSLFSTVLILAVTFYQGLQGLFTGLINCILAVLSAAVAFGFYENVYFAFLADRQPDYGRAIALVGIFVVTLLVLRTAVDSLIKGNVHFPVYVDRAGGGIFGFFTAMIIVGMLSIGFQMLPFPPDFLGFARFKVIDKSSGEAIAWRAPKKGEEAPLPRQDWSQVNMVRQRTWLNAGGFTTSLVSHLSTNALRGRQDLTFAEIHPDFLAETYSPRANALGSSRLTAKRDSVQIVGYWDLPPNGLFERERITQNDKKRVKLKKADPPESGEKDIAIRVKLTDARDEGGDAVRFTPALVRLFIREKPEGPLKECQLFGINDDATGAGNSLVQVYPGEPLARSETSEMDWVFRVPEEAQLVYLEFKQDARAEITPSHDRNKQKPLPIGVKPPKPGIPRPRSTNGGGTDTGSGGTPPSGSNPPSGYGRIAVIGPAEEVALTDRLPFTVTSYGGNAEVTNGVVKGGRLHTTLGPDWMPPPGNNPPAERFEVPADKRMLQVNVIKLQPGSWLGNVMSTARENIGDFYMKDASGHTFPPMGIYAIASVGGQRQFELIYLDETAREIGAHLPKLERIHSRDLQGDYALYFLFIVPPGTKPVEIHTGGTPVDLRSFNVEVK